MAPFNNGLSNRSVTSSWMFMPIRRRNASISDLPRRLISNPSCASVPRSFRFFVPSLGGVLVQVGIQKIREPGHALEECAEVIRIFVANSVDIVTENATCSPASLERDGCQIIVGKLGLQSQFLTH